MRNKLFTRIIITTLLVTLLTFNVGRVTCVSALAEEITPELEPVYDTEVVSLKDYVDNVLTDAQVAVFNILLGSYVASQAGLNEYDLEYPYTDRSGVIGWLQDAGMKLYNAIISGGSFDLVTGTDLRTYIVTAASYAIGMAQKAHTYTDTTDFLDDIDNSTHYFVPIDPILQASINSYFGRSYGLWNWQFDSRPFTSDDFVWNTISLGAYQQSYNEYVSSLGGTLVKLNRLQSQLRFFDVIGDPSFDDELILFLDSSSGNYYVTPLTSFNDDFNFTFNCVAAYSSSGSSVSSIQTFTLNNCRVRSSVNLSNFDTLVEAVRYIFNHPYFTLNTLREYDICLSDLVHRVFVGSSWANKQEIFNITSLNFEQNESPSYNQVPDNCYIDLKGFLTDIVNNTNILNVILDNLFKPDGTLNVDPALIKVSITIPDTNPLPVNLNDIQEYTDNVYLDVVRERVDAFSDTVGSFVAFWHNIDYEIVYAVFGSALIVLLGAFIGKWGHS